MKKIPLHIHTDHRVIISYHYFPSRYELVHNSPTPDIIILHTGSEQRPFLIYRQILNARIRFGWRPLIYAYFYEVRNDFRANWRDIDYIFSYAPSYGKNCQLAYSINPLYKQYLIDKRAKNKTALVFQPKTKFCNFVYSNHESHDTKVRINFCQELMKYKPVDCPGKSLNNMPSILPYLARHGAGIKAKLRFLASAGFNPQVQHPLLNYNPSR